MYNEALLIFASNHFYGLISLAMFFMCNQNSIHQSHYGRVQYLMYSTCTMSLSLPNCQVCEQYFYKCRVFKFTSDCDVDVCQLYNTESKEGSGVISQLYPCLYFPLIKLFDCPNLLRYLC